MPDVGFLATMATMIVVVGLFWLRARQRRRPAISTPVAVQPWSVRKSLGWAGALIVIDALILNQGVIAALVGVWTLGVSLPRAVFTKIREEKRLGLARVGILLGAAVMVFALNWANNQIARSRAETLVTAIRVFNERHRRYPAKLDELVPDFIGRVPVAKYALISGSFQYVSRPGYHALLYVEFPPFGRPVYNFERDTWGHLD
jgi:hypothetical protein